METEYFVYKLIPPRPSFALDMSEEELGVMAEHAAYWQRYVDDGSVVAFGPVLDPAGTWGLAIVRSDDDQQVRTRGDADPAVVWGMRYEVYPMPGARVASTAAAR